MSSPRSVAACRLLSVAGRGAPHVTRFGNTCASHRPIEARTVVFPAMRGRLLSIPVDAERYSPEQVRAFWVDPPNLQAGLARNTVVVGPYGTGKTHLLRTLELRNEGRAVLLRINGLFGGNRGGSPRANPKFVPDPVVAQNREMMLIAGILRELESNSATEQAVGPVARELFGVQDGATALRQLRVDEGATPKAGWELEEALKQVADAVGVDVLWILLDQGEKVGIEEAAAIESLLRRSPHWICILACQPGNPYLLAQDVAPADDYDIRTTVYDIRLPGQRDALDEVIGRRTEGWAELDANLKSAVISMSFGVPRVASGMANMAETSRDVRLLVDEAAAQVRRDMEEVEASPTRLGRDIVESAVPDNENVDFWTDHIRVQMPEASLFDRHDGLWLDINLMMRRSIFAPVNTSDLRPFVVAQDCWVHPGLVQVGLTS